MKVFKKKEKKKKTLIVTIVTMALLVLIVGITYAEYKQETEVLFINARVGKFVANDIELAMLLDGKEVETPPEKNSLYQVAVNCDNATGVWLSDGDKWGAYIDNITAAKVKCEVNFATPGATLTNITATSDKTTINLSYTAGGIATSTTCVYGTSTDYGNEVEGTTNTKCNISGLSMDTTYYYKVCAKNATGEVCKDGSIKTKPNTQSINVVKVGDYISMTPTSTSYKISKSLTGNSTAQTINPSELNLWRVIKKNEDGTIDVVSEYISSKMITWGGGAYGKVISGLEEITKQYEILGKTKGSRYLNANGTYPYACDNDIGRESTMPDTELIESVYGNSIAETPSGSAGKYLSGVVECRTSSYCGGLLGGAHVGVVTDKGKLSMDMSYSPACNQTTGTDSKSAVSGSIRPILVIISEAEILDGNGSKLNPFTLY